MNSVSKNLKFLRNHESWFVKTERSGERSFAVKLDLKAEICRKDLEELGLRELIIDFAAAHQGYSADVNGDEDKYLVLYHALGRNDRRRMHCYTCGKWTLHQQEQACTEPGCDGRLEKPIVEHAGYGVSPDEFEDWKNDHLHELVTVVKAFEALAGRCASAIQGHTLMTEPS